MDSSSGITVCNAIGADGSAIAIWHSSTDGVMTGFENEEVVMVAALVDVADRALLVDAPQPSARGRN